MRRALALALSAASLAGCTKVGTTGVAAGSGNPWTHHGRLVFAEAQDAKSLNPMLATSAATGDLSMFLFSYAVRYDQNAKPHPDALVELPTLENGDVSRDGLTLKYKLRPNIYFHDGVQLTCRDLAFSWKAAINPANNNITTDGYKDIKSIDCSDPLVAVVHMKRVYAPFLQQLWGVNGNVPILPAHLLEKVNDAKGSFNTAPYQSAPIGSGPFQFVRWDRGSQVVMKAFDKYFMGPPKLREVVWRILPDENTLVEQVRTHEIDMALRVGAQKWPEMQNIPGTVTVAPPIYQFNHIDFNLKRPMFQNDLQLRRAFAYATDRATIVAKIVHGLGDLTDTALSPRISPGWTSDTAHYPFDVAKARAMLDADGWKVGPDGIRVKNGVRLAFNLQTQTESTTGKAVQTLVQSEWHDVGADVSIKNVPTAQFFDNSSNGTLQGAHYDVALFSWVGAADPDDSAIYSGHNMAPKGQNALFWNDPVATAAMDGELATVDPVVRKKNFVIEQQRFALDVPSIVIYYARDAAVYNDDLKGYQPSPVISPFWDPQDLSI